MHFCVHLTNIRVFRNKYEVTILVLPAGLLQDAVVVALDLLPEVAPALHNQFVPLGVDVLLLLLQVATLLQYLLLLLLLFLWKVIDRNTGPFRSMLLTDSLLQLGDVVQLPLAAVLGSDLVLAATPASVNI